MVHAVDGVPTDVHRVTNQAASPFRYVIHPQDQFRITMEIEDAGEQIAAIYHSHTKSPAEPSQTDINLAKLGGTDLPAFPGTLYLIVGVKNAEADLRTWSIVGDEVTQVELEVTE